MKRRTQMFRALSHRNYRLFWSGAFLSNIGTWMQAVAQGYLVYDLTHSSLWLGLDSFVALSPGLVLTLLGGVFADLIDRRRLILYTQAVAGLTALSLAICISTNVIHRADNIWDSRVWIILAFSFVTGCCMSLAGPSYQALTFDLVGREDVANAVALNSTQFQLSRVVGPAFAGIGFKFFGLAGCFYANGFSFIAVVVALALQQVGPVHPARGDGDEEHTDQHRSSRHALGDATVGAGLRAHALVAAADVLEDADLRLQVVADDIAIPALRQRLDETNRMIRYSLADAYRAKGDLTRAVGLYRQALAIDVSIFGERHPDVAWRLQPTVGEAPAVVEAMAQVALSGMTSK